MKKIIYELLRKLGKTVILPSLDAIIRVLPKRLRVFLFVSLADSLVLTNVRFDTKMNIHPDRESTLSLGLFPNDRSVVPSILASGQWELSEPKFVSKNIQPSQAYTLVDVGANFGLFSLQLLELLKNNEGEHCISSVFLFEPDPFIAPILRQNVAQIANETTQINVVEQALGKERGTATFYLDNANKANNSLAPGAMSRAMGGVTEVQVKVIAGNELLELVQSDNASRIIYKSDLQGIDPDVVSAIPLSFWANVDVMIIELWPQVLKDYDYDKKAFHAVVSQFDTVILEEHGKTKNVSIEEIESILESAADYRYFNLLCSRISSAT